MSIFGKLIGAALGFSVAGIFGAVLGGLIGHFFDRGLGSALRVDYRAERSEAERSFFETAFTLMGALAKADGRISEAEIAAAEQLMARMGLTAEHRREAINLFKRGSQPDFQIEPQVSAFLQKARRAPLLPPMLLEFLFAMALADGDLHPAERDILLRVGRYLGMHERQLEQLLAMLQAQRQFHAGGGQAGPRPSAGPGQLQAAYAALGVDSSASDAELKRAYRKLMSRHHPDKLTAQGMPEDMVRLATEKSQEIRAAYDLVRESRGVG